MVIAAAETGAERTAPTAGPHPGTLERTDMKFAPHVLAAGLCTLIAAGGASATTLTFQQQAAGYAGTQDTELWGGSPTTPLGLSEQSFSVDGDNGGSQSQGLIRFDGLFGAGAGQIKATDVIVSARLTLVVTSEGSGFTVHDLLQDWGQASATWASFGGGVQADGIEAVAAPIASFGQNDSSKHVFFPSLEIDVTASLARAQLGQLPGYGWALLPFPQGTNGVDFATGEAIGTFNHPLLTVQVQAVPEAGTPALWLTGLAALAWIARRRKA